MLVDRRRLSQKFYPCILPLRPKIKPCTLRLRARLDLRQPCGSRETFMSLRISETLMPLLWSWKRDLGGFEAVCRVPGKVPVGQTQFPSVPWGLVAGDRTGFGLAMVHG